MSHVIYIAAESCHVYISESCQTYECIGRTANRGALALKPPHAIRHQSEPIRNFRTSTFVSKKFGISLHSPGSTRFFFKKQVIFETSIWALADCEWRAAAAGLKPLRLPHSRY